jgi:hypothetical protein
MNLSTADLRNYRTEFHETWWSYRYMFLVDPKVFRFVVSHIFGGSKGVSMTYLERPKCYGPDKKILFKKQLFDLEVKGQGPTKVITVCNTPHYGYAPTYQI